MAGDGISRARAAFKRITQGICRAMAVPPTPGDMAALVVDDHSLVRGALAGFLKADGRFTLVREASSCQEAVACLAERSWGLVVLDAGLPDGNAFLLLDHVRKHAPGSRVLVYSGTVDAEIGARLLEAGAAGFVEKSAPPDVLREAVDLVAFRGRRFAGDREFFPSESLREDILTDREREVATRIALSQSTKEIAVQMGLSASTVDNHRTNLMRKLGVHDAAGVTRAAIQRGWVPAGG